VNSPGVTLIDLLCTKNGLVLGELFDVLERAEDDVCHLLGVRDAYRVGCALDLHNLASPDALGHEAVGRHGDVQHVSQ
jgi:hypothetical protein